jgi:hypothetical protein
MLDNLKMMLGIEQTDTDLDAKLNLIISLTTSRLQALLGGIVPPAELDYIITEVAIIRFNRIGSEGLASQSVEGESLTFKDSDFDGFADDIQAFLNSQKASTRGKVRFI